MADFSQAVEAAKRALGIDVILKEKQTESLRHLYIGKDVITVLPTGYGKSLIYQLLPWMFQLKHDQETPMVALVISPLTSLMEDQVMEVREKGVSACFLNIHGSGGRYTQMTASVDDDSDLLEEDVYLLKGVSLNEVARGDFTILYMHPEALGNKTLQGILRSSTYSNRVCAIVVDEAHMVSECKYGEPAITPSMFQHIMLIESTIIDLVVKDLSRNPFSHTDSARPEATSRYDSDVL
ncbi:ATP-dependent DNA helicase Q-like 3 [Pecten maximus]|uniref:ATP-dependent DNA helicase Q-like 3 n=1 Tax=Pecten maximus TaxID=6579 RepID=UPI001458FC86|nr:ATP-dependent DNA helicase Q-like 3 [Pecten maximus]